MNIRTFMFYLYVSTLVLPEFNVIKETKLCKINQFKIDITHLHITIILALFRKKQYFLIKI